MLYYYQTENVLKPFYLEQTNTLIYLAYFEVYQDIFVNQFDTIMDSLKELSLMGEESF